MRVDIFGDHLLVIHELQTLTISLHDQESENLRILSRTNAVYRNHHKAQQREGIAHVHCWMAKHSAAVYNCSLERGHQGSTHNGHHQEGGSQGGIGEGDLFQCRSVDGGEHKAHEETDAHQAVESGLAYYEDGTQAAQGGSNAKDGEEPAAIHIFHQEGAHKAAREEQAHGHYVVVLCRGLADAQVVGILDDEGPDHNLSGHIEHLGNDAFAIDLVVKQAI